MNGLERARDLQAEVQELLTAEAVDDVEVLLDPLLIPSALASAGAAVIIAPPKQTFPTQLATTNEWNLWAIAGPVEDQLAAWERLDAIITALREPLCIEVAEADSYEPHNSAPYPAYRMQFTETI